MKIATCLAIAAAGVVTAVLVPATAGASVDAPTGAEPTRQKAEAQAVATVGARPETKLEVRKVDPAELEEIGIQAFPSVCTPSDGEPFGYYIGENLHGISCYEAVGDDHWVLDTLANDTKFWVYWQTEYDEDGDGKPKDGYCGDTTAGGWTECKYDHREHECIIFSGYRQHNFWWAWSPWVSTTTGDRYCVRD